MTDRGRDARRRQRDRIISVVLLIGIVVLALTVNSTFLWILATIMVTASVLVLLEARGRSSGVSTKGTQNIVIMLTCFVLAGIIATAADSWWEWGVALLFILAGVGGLKLAIKSR